MGEKSNRPFRPSEVYEPTDEWIIQIAEKFGQLPDAVEAMDSYWFRRIAVLMEGEAMNSDRQRRAMKNK